ncbi:MAG: hypothetical protein QXZ12_01365 [Thermoplasmata archaeon]
MGKLELDMERNWYPAATRYVTYVTRYPELRGSKIGAEFQILIDKLEIPGAKSTFLGTGSKKLPDKIKVTVEWEDVNEEVLKE